MKRIVSIARAFLTESARRVPWVILVLVVLLMFQSMNNSAVSNKNQISLLKQIASQSKAIKKLSEDNKKLSQQAIDLSNRSAKQVDCVKQLFVDYINSGQPITRIHSDECRVAGVETVESSPKQVQPTQSSNIKKNSAAKTDTTAKPTMNFLQRLLKSLKLF